MSLIQQFLVPILAAHNLIDPAEKTVGELSQYSTYTPVGSLAGINPDPSGRDYLYSYEVVPYIYRSVFILSASVAKLPILIEEYDQREGVWNDVTKDPEFDIFRTYNESQTHYDFWEQTIGYLSLTGEVPWIIKRTPSGIPSQLYPFNPEYLKIIPKNDFQIDSYVFAGAGKELTLDGDDIFFIKYFNPSNAIRGLSPIAAAANDVTLDLNAVTANKASFSKGAQPSGLISTDEEMDDPTWERTRSYLKEQYSGSDNFGKIMFLTNGLKWQQMAMSNRDLQYMDQRKWSKKTVGMVFGVPDILLMDFADASVLANADIQYKLLWETLEPVTIKLSQIITEHLLPQLTNRSESRFRFDLSGVSALQPDLNKLAERFEKGIRIAAASPNDYRQHILKLDRDPDPAMDQKYIEMGLVPLGSNPAMDQKNGDELSSAMLKTRVKLEQLKESLSQLQGTDPVDKIVENSRMLQEGYTLTQHGMFKSAVASIIAQVINKVEPKFSKVLEAKFKQQSDEILENLNANKGIALEKWCEISGLKITQHKTKIKYSPPEDYNFKGSVVGGCKFTVDGVQFDYENWVKEFEEAGEPYIAESLLIAGAALSESIGETFNATDRVTTSYIENRSHQYAEMVNTTTASQLNKLIAEGIEQGLTIEQMASKLESYFNNNNRMRAQRIARTESVNGCNAGRIHAMKQSKRIDEHMWITQRDKSVRESHIMMDGTVVKVGESFPGNDGFESAWPSSPNERCSTIPVRVEPKK